MFIVSFAGGFGIMLSKLLSQGEEIGKTVLLAGNLLAEDLGLAWDGPLGIPSMPYVQAKCYHYPLSLNDLSFYHMGLVKSVTAASGHQTKVKWEEGELSMWVHVFACVCELF